METDGPSSPERSRGRRHRLPDGRSRRHEQWRVAEDGAPIDGWSAAPMMGQTQRTGQRGICARTAELSDEEVEKLGKAAGSGPHKDEVFERRDRRVSAKGASECSWELDGGSKRRNRF